MAIPKFLEVTINILGFGKQKVTIEKGCSFENNGKIYRVNNDCKLSIFDKAAKTWAAGDEITMTSYQFDTFQSVTNIDTTETYENGKTIQGSVFSKKDLDKAKEIYFDKDHSLTEELNKNLSRNYTSKDVTYYSNYDGFSANITNGVPTQSATLIFKSGEAKDATVLSEIVNRPAKEENKTAQKSENKAESKTEKKEPKTETKKEKKKPVVTQQTNKTDEAARKTKPKKEIAPAVNTFVATQKAQPQKVKRNANLEKIKNESIQKIENIVSKFKGGKIDIDKVHNLETVAKYTGLSERYVRDILIGLEGKKKWPLLKAEYDHVACKGHPNGYLTVGFGHTDLTGAPKLTENTYITEKQAYQILANDIITAKNTARGHAGKLYDDAPKSIQHAMIDLAFNKGGGAINASLKANLENGYMGSAALRTWYDTNTTGLYKRNMYRFIEACHDISTKEKQSAIKRFFNEHSTQLIKSFNADVNAKHAWNDFCKKSKSKEFCVK